MIRILQVWALVALGVLVAAHTSSGIRYDSSTALVIAVILLSVLNAVLRPLLVLFTLPFVVLTMGLGLFLINAVLFWLTARLVPGFHVDGFLSALWGSVVTSLTMFAANALLGWGRKRDKREKEEPS